jgi:peptide/nickel transport system substrate-binding protein
VNPIRTVLIALALLPTCLVVPVRAENVVRWATPLPADSFDPYGHDELFTIWVTQQVYESLTNYDWRGRLEPGLAVSWHRLDALTWEMELRQGVTFHDGTPFTSADVVFTFDRAKAETSPWRTSLQSIARVEVIDADTIRFTAASANPIPWEDLYGLAIMSKAWTERHGAALPAQLGDDGWDYVETHANGTGPFMLEEFEPGERTVLVRNDSWWGLGQHPHNIDRIVQTRVSDPAHGTQLLLGGEIDLLQSPPPDQLERIAATPGLKVQKGETNQTLYVGFDLASPELRSSNVKGRNPFAGRVRVARVRIVDDEREAPGAIRHVGPR